MKTAMAKFTNETTLLIQGVKGKFNTQGNISDEETKKQLGYFIESFLKLIHE